jgi:hypothetical protein
LWNKPSQGAQGSSGKDDERGYDGGSFKFRGSFSFPKDELKRTVTLTVHTRGGKGGDGGNEGAGGEGEDGIKSNNTSYKLHWINEWDKPEPYEHGAAGGSGGAGGKGGTGGNGGDVDIVYDLFVDRHYQI